MTGLPREGRERDDEAHGDATSSAGQPTPQEAARREAARRRRRAAVFGDVLPESTSDERGPGGDEAAPRGDEWLRAQVPPHHG